MNQAKKYFNVLRNNEDLSYAGLKTLKLIEDEFDRVCCEPRPAYNTTKSILCPRCKSINTSKCDPFSMYCEDCGNMWNPIKY